MFFRRAHLNLMDMEILIKPIVTEKMTNLGTDLNRYGFVVHKNANKIQIKQAVEKMYGVSVESVNTIRYGGKAKSRFTKSGVISGKTKSFKKAIITLAEGEMIDFYSNI
jgi:large subunit ribosomal protein L23